MAAGYQWQETGAIGKVVREVCEASERPCPRGPTALTRSEEHTSELQSLRHLVCRLLLEKKKKKEKNKYKTIKKIKEKKQEKNTIKIKNKRRTDMSNKKEKKNKQICQHERRT